MKQNVSLFAFNRGIISNLGLARTDLKRTALSAEIQNNYMPRSLGSMMLRPGFAYTGTTRSSAAAFHVPFIFSSTDTAIIEFTDSIMRVKINEAWITRTSVTTTITNGSFDTNVTGWTDADESGATSAWETGGLLSLLGTGTNAAIRTQQVTVSGANLNVEHALNITVTRGPVTLRVGSTSGADDYITETPLGTGVHSLAFTPSGDFYIHLSNRRAAASLLDQIIVASSGVMEMASPFLAADLPLIRYDQSADVVYLACNGYQQRKIERRGTRSWSIVKYDPEDGPFRSSNLGPITLTPSALTGDITLSASASLFRTTHVGALFQITSTGQRVDTSFSSANTFGDPIRVTGTGDSRKFTIIISGTFTATVTLQRSVGAVGSWEDLSTYTTSGTTLYNDSLDNQIIFYRLGVKTGNYTSGTAVTSLVYSLGSITGVVRVTGYSSSTSVGAQVLTALGGVAASSDWAEGAWSDYRGYPTAVCLHEGRLWWAGKDKIHGSVSDAFESYDDTTEGDSGPISRSIGSGPVDTINWLLPMQRLIIGGQGAEHTARSNSLDEPLTPTAFTLKTPSTQGSAAVAAAKVDSRGVFVQASGRRLYEAEFDSNTNDYATYDLSLIAPEILEAGVVRIAVQRQPDTRIHCVLDDGTVAILIYNKAEDLKCWVTVDTDGLIEDAFVLPGTEEDKVYYLVNRTINGATVRYLERWAMESECQGGTLNKQADSYVSYTGASTTTVTAEHLANEEVVVWGDGESLGTFTLNGSGTATLASAVTNYIVGLSYTARFKSTKLAYAAQAGTPLNQKKRVDHIGLILANTHYQGLRYGSDFDYMDELPLVEDGVATPADTVWESYDRDSVEFNGIYDTDSRLCLESIAPKPCTLLAVTITMQTHEKA